MGFLDFIFGASKTPQEELQQEVQRATARPPRRGVIGFLRGSDPEFQKGVSDVVRRQNRQQTFEHERQEIEEERRYKTIEKPRMIYDIEQSWRVPYLKDYVKQLEQQGSPYLPQAKQQLKSATDQVSLYVDNHERNRLRQKYDRKSAFVQQQKDYSNQTYEQAYKQLETARQERAKQQAISQAMYTQSNTPGRGGQGERPLGRGPKFSRFAPPQARGSFGRGGPRPSFTRPGK